MEIDADAGRYGSMLIFTDLKHNPKEALREILDIITINVEQKWADCLNLDGIQHKRDIDQIFELEYLINFRGFRDVEKTIKKLSGYFIKQFSNQDLPIAKKTKIEFKAKFYLELKNIDEELDEYDQDEETDDRYKVATFRVNIEVI